MSVVIRSKDEADRLRLTLSSLACQTERPEVVVVNDGSTDHTADVVAAAAGDLDIIAIHHAAPAGRSGAANVGAARATGEIVLFLDGDTLAAPDLVAQHLSKHIGQDNLVVRGETWHLRGTRPFLDPETGSPRAGEEAKVARMPPAEFARALVTRRKIAEAFEEIDGSAQPGIYPGYGPRRLFELEMEALNNAPECKVLWAAASGSNQSLRRDAFLAVGGFHPNLSINEHRELALRLTQNGCRMTGTPARTYHMIHRSGWRDPLHEKDWEDTFYAEHPTAEVALMPILWASLGDSSIPEAGRIHSLPALEAAAARCASLTSREAVRSAHMKWSLGSP
ncbi:glycosyltransferase family 2 protein [Labrys okinawensis]|uniref:glycosyltransferase family 2 protein n=1 Tax=Labrys okinawensis TaxID=346911 RepID=UPI0039BD4F17